MTNICIHYRFQHDDRWERAHPIELDPHSLEMQTTDSHESADWTNIGFCQCPNCPLDSEESPRCPVAVNLEPLIEGDWDQMCSYSDIRVEVVTPERTISAKTTLQRGMSALLGLIMATSDCPHTRFLRPMARFHLPLATDEETTYRAASMYLLGQYFSSRKGRTPDLELLGLKRAYENLTIINGSLARRVRKASDQDAAVNAVVLLDLLAKNLPYSIDDALEEIRYLFAPYIEAAGV